MIRSTLVAAAALAAALIAPATSLAGGWATVGLSSVPDGARPGEVWVVDLTVLQHGRTPLEGVQPRVLVDAANGGASEVFTAKPTQRPGIYRARVVFPSAGEWTYSVDDGFSQIHQLGSVRIGGADQPSVATPATARLPARPPDPDRGGMSWIGALGIAAAAGLLAAMGSELLRRRHEPKPAEG
jgi:YtkA-like protein